MNKRVSGKIIMSYDLDLFRPQTGIDPITTIEQAALHNDSAQHEANQNLLDVLVKDNQEFRVEKTDAAIHVMESQHGIKISLYHSGGHVNIPYWHTDEKAQRLVFWDVRRYLRLIQSETAYAIYDSQLGRMVSVEQDMPAIIASYKQVIANMPSFL
jgi:hypothetical protein